MPTLRQDISYCYHHPPRNSDSANSQSDNITSFHFLSTTNNSPPLQSPESITNTPTTENQRRLWQARLQQELAHNPDLTTDFSAISDHQDQRIEEYKKRTAFDPFTIFREYALKNWNPESQKDVTQIKKELQQTLQLDLQVFVEEHFRLQYQSRQIELNLHNPQSFFTNMLASCEQNNRKELALLKNASTYEDYKLHAIRYRRSLLEHQQVQKMSQLVSDFFAEKKFTPIKANELLGAVTKQDLNKINLNFTTHSGDAIHQGRLATLDIDPEETVLASPRFGLAMPANGFVHPGNQSYANSYQIIIRLGESENPTNCWLLSDHYYSDLSLNELEQVLKIWEVSPGSNSFPKPETLTNTPLPEEIIMSVVDALPDRYTSTKPFLTFLQLANHLEKKASSPDVVINQQNSTSQKIKQKEQDVAMAAALLTEILLTELSLCRYLPDRHEYVGEVLQSAFEMVVLPLITSREIHYDYNLYQEIKSNYHRVWVEYQLTNVNPLTDNLNTINAKTSQIHHVFANNPNLQALNNEQMKHSFSGDDVFVKQKQAVTRYPWLTDFSNMMILLSSLPEATQGVFSCAACAGGLFGGLKNSSALKSTSIGVKNTVDSAKNGVDSFWGNLFTSNDDGMLEKNTLTNYRHINGQDIYNNNVGRFINNSYANANDVVSAYESRIPASELLFYLIAPSMLFR